MSNVIDEQQEAIDRINKGESLFVSGVGGTGKSWIINQIRNKQGTIVTAPTGIAAINVQGVTCHKMFGLPFGLVTDRDYNQMTGQIAKIHTGVSLIIIDEIAMVRADYLDLIDWKLKRLRDNEEPFGGIQVCVFGDPLQLEPILSSNEKEYFYEEYDTPFFFSANCWNFPMIELTKVYRQKDKRQVKLLNSIRKKDKWYKLALKRITDESKPYINDKDTLTLCCYNKDADDINKKHYEELNTKIKTFYAVSDNIIKWEKDQPIPSSMSLKLGVKVIICANGEDYKNGERGEVVDFIQDYVLVKKQDGVTVKVFPNTWEKFKYKRTESGIDKEPETYYTQIPLRLGFAISVHKCLPSYTKIDKINEKTTLDNIEVGDLVYTGKSYKEVLNKWDSGYKKNFTLSTKQGFSIDSSEDHKFLVSRGGNLPEYIPLKDIKIGDFLSVDISRKHYQNKLLPKMVYSPRSKKLTKEIVNDQHFSYVIGLLIGDGCYSTEKDGRLELSNSDNNVIQYFKGFMEDKGLNTTTRKGNNCYMCYTHSTPLRTMLQEIGLDYVKAKDKSIPEILMQSSFTNRCHLLSGLIDTDGCVNSNKVRYTTISSKLAEQVKDLWLTLGVYAYILCQNDYSYTVIVSGAELYKVKEILHLKNKTKKEKVDNFKQTFKTNMDTIPFTGIVSKECSKVLRQNGYVLYKDVEEGLWKHSKYNSKGRYYLLDLMNKYKETKDLFHDFINENIMYVKVTDIQENGEVKMYDIEVEEHHSFTANNFIVHNCQGMTLDNVALHTGRGCFSAGQLYVALSRVKDLRNLSLVQPLKHTDVIVRREVIDFYERHNI